MNHISRRSFIKNSMLVTGGTIIANPVDLLVSSNPLEKTKTIKINVVNSNFEREPLVRPFGFKGGYMTEIWQTAAKMQSESGNSTIGISSQNVLYSDANIFAEHSEAAGNALMFSLTDKALQITKNISFNTPVDLIEKLLPEVVAEGKKLTDRKDMNEIFALNALTGVDNAAWLMYGAENKLRNFSSIIPPDYKEALSYKNDKVAILYLASYNLPVDELKRAVKNGYFVIKIKIGQPGTQAEMLQKDIARLAEVHHAIKDMNTKHTKNGKLIYTLDANCRYEKKETFMRLIDAAKKMGAFEQILFVEEPLNETNDEHVGDIGVRIAADESAHNEAGVLRRLEQGYGALALKGIAKTLSLSMKIAKIAHEKKIPCLCADLTVNPILVDWHKNLAARLAPFPGLDMGLMETNGDLNYSNWGKMQSYHPANAAPWTIVNEGVFNLDADFFHSSGGIFDPMPHYEAMFNRK